MAVAVTPKDFAEVQSQLSSRGSVYERQKYLRGLAVSHSRENVDKLIDELISEGTSDISKANWAHSIALFLATVLQDVDTLETIVALTPSTKVRIKAAETLVKDLHASGDRVRLYEVSEGLLFKQAPHLKRAVLNIIVNDNMQDLADTLVDDIFACYGPHLATQLLPVCSQSVVRRLLPLIVPRPGPTARKLILRYPQAMFDFITTSYSGETLAVGYAAEVACFIRHRINIEPNAVSLLTTYMDAILDTGKTNMYWILDRGIMPILVLLMEYGYSKEAVQWLRAKSKRRQLSYKDDPWNIASWAARDWPVEALVRDLGKEEAFALLADVVSLEYMHTLTRRLPDNDLRYDLIAFMWRKAVSSNIPLARIPTLDVCIALKGRLELLGQVAIQCFKYFSDSKQFTNDDRRWSYVEYMPATEADTILADRLKSSDSSKRSWAYSTRLMQALHYDKEEHRLPQVLGRTVKEIANEQNPVRGNVMGTLCYLPMPPLCGPKSNDPHAVVEAIDALVASLNRSKEQLKGSSIVDQGKDLIENIIRNAPMESELYKVWEKEVMEAFDRLLKNDNTNRSVINDGFLMNIPGIRKATVEHILQHLSVFLEDILQRKDSLTKDLIQDLRAIFRLVGRYGSRGEGLKLPIIRPIVDDIIANTEKYTFQLPRHPAGTIDMLIEIQTDLVEFLTARPWSKDKEQCLEKVVAARPTLLTDNDGIYRLARKRLPSIFIKIPDTTDDSSKEGEEMLKPPRCYRGFSGGPYPKEDLDMSWWTDAEVAVIDRMVGKEFSLERENRKSLSYRTKHHHVLSSFRTVCPSYFVNRIEDNLSSLSDNAVVDDKQKRQYDDDDTLALMEVDLKLLSRMDTVDAESAKVFLRPELLTTDAARTAPFCLARVASTTLTEDQLFDDFIGATFRKSSGTAIKLTVHKELCHAAARFGSIDRRQYWLKYRLFTRDGARKHVHKDIVQAIGSAFIHNMLWCSDWQVLETCMDMSKEVPDALSKYVVPRPTGYRLDSCDTTEARCRYIKTVLLPVFENTIGEQDIADSCITALEAWSEGKPDITKSAESAIVIALKRILTDKNSPYSLFSRALDLFSTYILEGSNTALTAYVEAFDSLLEGYWKPAVNKDEPMNPDDDEGQRLEALIRRFLQTVRAPLEVENLKTTLGHIADALEGVVGLGSLWSDARIQYILAGRSPSDLNDVLPSIKDHLDTVEGNRDDLVSQCINTITKWLGPEFPIPQVSALASSSDYRLRLLAVQLYNTRDSDERSAAITALWRGGLCRDSKLAVREEAFRAVTHLRMLL